MQTGDRDGERFARLIQGHVALGDRDFTLARQRYREVLSIAREIGVTSGIAVALSSLANVEYETRNYSQARELFQQALELDRQVGNMLSTCKTLFGLADATIEQGDLVTALAASEEAHSIAVALDSPSMLVASLWQMAVIVLEDGDHRRAERLLQDSVRVPPFDYWEENAFTSLAELATVWAIQGKWSRAVQLWGASVEGSRSSLQSESHHSVARRERIMTVTRAQLDPSAWRTAWDRGEGMSFQAAVTYALEET